jgi:hypothetical protein
MKQSPPATLVLLTTAFIGSFARANRKKRPASSNGCGASPAKFWDC